MYLKISKSLAEGLGEEKLRAIGVEYRDRSYREEYQVDLRDLTSSQVTDLRGWLEDMVALGVRGPKTLIRDINTWFKAIEDAGDVKARTLQHFSAILTQYLRGIPGHRVYQRLDGEGLAHVCYYVNDVTYTPADKRRDYYHPAEVDVSLRYINLGGRTNSHITFEVENAQGMTASEALVKMGYFPETPELREAYLAETDRFNIIAMNLGQQFLAIGTGTDDLDGNPQSGWSSYNRNALPMMREGQPSKVVIDVFYESDKERRNSSNQSVDTRFWSRNKPKMADHEDDDDALMDRDVSIEESIEIPVHPFCATFDLKRHLRLKIHVNYLTEYVYNDKIAEHLVLPNVDKDLVATLISQSKVNFADIVAGKGGGVCVLLTGVPGVGKTLTAEVFAESSQRPLYSIQAAQLGINADRVEDNLMRFLARGSRWNAVVLIDEADVYIQERDRNMEHNAIVASFLRVLEYQTSVLFMTTNLAKLVDDAIASRCIARIDYKVPDVGFQEQIWHVLSDLNEAHLSDEQIHQIVLQHDDLTGRDIKQLLKLASLVSANQGEEITPETINFVSQFRPTKVAKDVEGE